MKNEDEYRLLAENMQDIVSQHSIDGLILWISPSVEQLLGYTREELLNTSYYDLLQEDDRDYMVNYAHDLALSSHYNENIRIEYRIRRKDGRLVWYESLTKPLTDENGQVTRLQVTSRDISKRHKTEEALKDSKEQLELALAGADLGSWDLNLKTGSLIFSERWAQMLGYSPWELDQTLRAWIKLVHPEDLGKVNQLLSEHLRDESTFYESEHRLQAKDGNWVWVLSRGKVLDWDDDGKPLRVVGTHLDITNHKKLETAVMRAIVGTQEEERTRFAKDLHDGIGQYLSAIRMHLDALGSSLNEDEGNKMMINLVQSHIDDTLEELRRITHDLSPGSLHDLGLIPALEELFDRVLSMTNLQLNFTPIEFASRLAPRLEINLFRVAQQLLSNTIQHAEAKHITLEIEKQEKMLKFIYHDDGKGMDVSNTRMNQGAGLRNISSRVKVMHGTIRFMDNRPGLRVQITIPLESTGE